MSKSPTTSPTVTASPALMANSHQSAKASSARSLVKADLAAASLVQGPNRVIPPTQMIGSQAIVRALEELGVTDIFGLPGGAILPTYDPLMASDLNHVLVRHEQGAGTLQKVMRW